MLGGRGDAAVLQRLREGDRGGARPAPAVEPKPRSVSAMSPPGRATSRTGARSTLTPTSRRLAAVRAALLAAEGGAAGAHLLRPRRSGRRRSASPGRPPGRPSPAAGRAAAAGAGSPAAARSARRPAARLGKLSAKRMTPATRPSRIIALHRRRAARCRGSRRRSARPASCAAASAAGAALGLRRRGAVAERDAEGEGADGRGRRGRRRDPPPRLPRSPCRCYELRSATGA